MKRILVLAALAVGSITASLAQTIVYDNTTTSLNNNFPLLPEWRDDSAEVGDEVWLGGSDREITNLKLLFWYRGTVPGTFDAIIRFRPIEGPRPSPGAAFFESDLFVNLPTTAGMNEYNFAIPHVIVPDRFAWTIEAKNRKGSVGELGPAYFNPATVGWSDDFFWQSDGGGEWINYSWGADPYANFGASLTAVPEPASLLGLVGGIGILARRRRNRSRS